MIQLNEIPSPAGARKKARRVGRGNAARRGNFAGRGLKGQLARGSINRGFEGGQLPLIKKLPMLRGFHNRFRVAYQPVNLDQLERLAKTESEITPELMLNRNLISSVKKPVKILGDGVLKAKLEVRAHAFSKSARKAIEDAKGQCVTLSMKPQPAEGSDTGEGEAAEVVKES